MSVRRNAAQTVVPSKLLPSRLDEILAIGMLAGEKPVDVDTLPKNTLYLTRYGPDRALLYRADMTGGSPDSYLIYMDGTGLKIRQGSSTAIPRDALRRVYEMERSDMLQFADVEETKKKAKNLLKILEKNGLEAAMKNRSLMFEYIKILTIIM